CDALVSSKLACRHIVFFMEAVQRNFWAAAHSNHQAEVPKHPPHQTIELNLNGLGSPFWVKQAPLETWISLRHAHLLLRVAARPCSEMLETRPGMHLAGDQALPASNPI